MNINSCYILSIDTSTQVCSVAIHLNGSLIANIETYKENSHSENLTLMIDKICEFTEIKLQGIDAFAFAKGPGSYTGLRIGCSAIKGLCFALNKPLIAISTLEVMASGLTPMASQGDYISPMLDARRMEVYQGLYDNTGSLVENEKALVLDENSFKDLLDDRRVLFAGSGSNKFKTLYSHPNAVFVANYHPLAKNMGNLSYQSYLKNKVEDLAYFEPEYLKEFYTSAKIVA